MITILLLLGLLNGDFSQGLDHWQAKSGWSSAKGAAALVLDNRTGTDTQGADLCSEAMPLNGLKRLRGAADVKAVRVKNGYVFVGVRWYDKQGAPLWTEMVTSNEGMTNRAWHRLAFVTDVPREAGAVSFCFFGGGYAGGVYRAQADNAELK